MAVIIDTIEALNRNPAIHGVLVQLPLPPESHADPFAVLGAFVIDEWIGSNNLRVFATPASTIIYPPCIEVIRRIYFAPKSVARRSAHP